MRKIEVINHLIRKFNYKSYLEIGIGNPDWNFNHVKVDDKDGVDPKGKCNFPITSDQFFKSCSKRYDLIFIDGLHLHGQVNKDIMNSLLQLKKGGTILCHDSNPAEKSHQTVKPTVPTWNGTVWKSIVSIRANKNLFVSTIDIAFGLSYIFRKKNSPTHSIIYDKLNYDFLHANRKRILNLITVKQFLDVTEQRLKDR